MAVSQRRIFAPRLSFKITLPYVALAMMLALATIYIVIAVYAALLLARVQAEEAPPRARLKIFFGAAPSVGGSTAASTIAATSAGVTPRAAAMRAIWKRAAAGETWGSSPDADAVISSIGTGRPGAVAASAAARSVSAATSRGSRGPRLVPLDVWAS